MTPCQRTHIRKMLPVAAQQRVTYNAAKCAKCPDCVSVHQLIVRCRKRLGSCDFVNLIHGDCPAGKHATAGKMPT